MTKPTLFSARHSLGEQLLSDDATGTAAVLFQGGDSHASASVAGIPPILLSQAIGGTAARTTIDLTFSTTMRAGTSGAIYITDGAVQTVLDSAGMPSLRIVGANDTREIALSSLRFSGEHVLIDGLDLLPGHHYSVVISPGALQSTESKAFAGVRSPGQVSFSTTAVPSGDTTGPTLDAIHLDATKLKAGQDIPVTLVFSEKVAAPSPSAFSTPHAELVDLYSDDGITWYGTLHATAAVAAVANAFTVDMSQIHDLAGNAGRGTPPAASYDVDTVVTAWVEPELTLGRDAGLDDMDLLTNGTTQDLMGMIDGRLEEGQYLELRINGTAVASETITLHDYSEGSFTGYAWVYHGPLPDGSNTVVVRVTDGVHSSVEYSSTVVVDNTAPVLSSTANGDTAFNPASDIVVAFSEEMYWMASEGTPGMIEIRDGDNNVQYVAFSLAQLSTDGRTLTIPASAHKLATGKDYIVSVPQSMADIAGNTLAARSITLHTSGTAADTTAPKALTATVMNTWGTYGVGAAIDIRVAVNEEVHIVDSATPSLVLNNGATATFVGMDSANQMLFRYVVASGQDVAVLDVTDWTSLVNSVADAAGNKLHDVLFTHLDNAGFTGASGIAIDTVTPGVLAAPVLEVSSDSGPVGDRITSDATPTVLGSGAEEGARIYLYDGGTIVGETLADSAGNWAITAAALPDGAHVLTVRQKDRAGNLGAQSAALNLQVDTVASAPTLGLNLAADTGTGGDRITSVKTPVLKGSAEAGARIELYEGATLAGSATADSAGNWSVTTTALADGAHTFHAVQKDVAGNLSAASANLLVTVDSTAPALTSTASGSTSFDPASAIVVNFNEAMAWKASGGNDSRIEVITGGHSTWVDFASSMLSADGRTVTIPASVLALANATDYTIRMPATLTDVAGNGLGAQSVSLHTGGVAADTTPPSALRAEVVTPAGSYTSGSTIEIHVALSEAVAMVGSAAPTLALNNGGTASFVTLNSDNEMVFRYVVAPGQDVSMLQVTGWSSLVDSVADLAGNRLDSAHITFTHLENSSAEIAGTSGIEVDSSAPATPAPPQLSSSSDSGTAGDGITSDSTPTLSGSGAEPGNAVYLYDIETLLDVIYADDTGHWSYTPIESLADRTHVFTVRQTDSAGNRSDYSPTLSVKVDTAAAAPSLALDAASDTGASGDNITRLNTPTIKGSAEAGARVELYEGSTLVGGVTADGSGNWSIATTALTDGSHTFTARQTDVAGNTSVASAGLTITVDTVAPSALGALVLVSDSGTVGDGITNDNTPTFSGSGAAPNATIQLQDAFGNVQKTFSADSSGNWSYEYTGPFADGGYSLKAVQLDTAGNASAPSPILSVTFDTVVIAPNMHLEFASDTGVSDYDRITSDTTPTFTGTSEAGATIKLYAGSTEVGSAVANASGDWSITTSVLPQGELSFGATQTDKAGNVSSKNGPIPVTIDTFAAAPGTPVLDLSTDTGVTGDGRTTSLVPKFTGSGAEAGAKVKVYAGADMLGETTADGSGNWSVTSHSLLTGTYSITALQVDKAGNTSASSGALALVIEPLAAFITVTFGAEHASVSGTASGADSVDGGQALAALVGVSSPWLALAEVPAF